MKLRPVWKLDAPGTSRPSLDRDIEVDVAVIGGGITGITTAALLADSGLNVAVLESRRVGQGTTGGSTGNLYASVDKRLEGLRDKYDDALLRLVVEARSAAIVRIAELVERHNIACDFQRVPFWLVAEDADSVATIERELDAVRVAGLVGQRVDGAEVPLPFKTHAAARVSDQAQLQPLQYVRGLASAIEGGCAIYEHAPVVDVREADGHCVLATLAGPHVKARDVVMATHTPKGTAFAHTVLAPYREYALAFRLRAPAQLPPPGIFWVLADDHHTSVRRVTTDEGESYLVALGHPHKVGQGGDTDVAIAAVVDWVSARFDVAEVRYAWGAQAYRPADGLPYIGPRASGSHVRYATGFAADGLVWGTVAAEIIRDGIRGAENRYAERFAYTRHTPIKSAVHFVKENVDVALQYLEDWPSKGDVAGVDEVGRDDGAVLEVKGHKLGVYRDVNDRLHVVSAVCTHLGCVVRFNRAERSWDCPCHGSRFGVDGTVLDGPAFLALPRHEAAEPHEEKL